MLPKESGHHSEMKKKRKQGNGHEKIDEIGNHQKAYGAGMKTSIALREFNRSRDEINFNFSRNVVSCVVLFFFLVI